MLQEDRLFSLQELNHAVQQHVFDVLTPSKLGMQRRRKICIVPAENLLRFHKDNDEIEARVPFHSITVVCKNAASDKQLTIETNAASEVLKFRSFIEREAFCRFVQAISPMVSVITDAEIVEDGKIVYHIETANMMGLASEGTLVLDPAKRSIEFAGQQIPVDNLQLDCPSGIPRRVDLTYVNLDRTLSLKLGRSKKKLSCNFPSLYHRERFCGRVRACQLGYRGNEEEIHMPTGETIKVYTATWNCGDKKPPASFEPWISAGTHDIYAIGLQECGPKQKWFKKLTAFLCSDEAAQLAEARYREMITSSARDPHSMTKLTSSFEDMQGMGYKLLSITSLWDIHLVVVVRADLRNRLSMLSSGTEATGIAHVLGNKGGAACGFTLDNSTAFTFVTSHLAARATRIPQRQENIESIIKGLHFEAVAPLKGMPVTHHSDYVFWLGDLNYRVDMGQHGSEEEFKLAVEYALTKQVDNLVAHCQLKREMAKNAVFIGFEEGPINFAPTYRLIKGKDEYSNKKNQNPSYCDRVLFKTAPGVREKIRQTHYTGVFELNQSDHRPVAAAFDVTLKAPFILRNSINDNSAVDCCVVNFSNLNFTVAPEVSHPVCRTVRYDGYTGPMAISFHSIALRSVEKTLPSACENPSVAPAAAKAAALQKKKKKGKKGKKGKGEKGVEESKDEAVEEADEADDSEADATEATTDPEEEDQNSEVEETKVSITTPELELPQWSWTDSQTPIIVPSVSDCEWLAEQLVVATVHRHTADGQVVGSCEIPLNLAINSRDRGSTNFKSAELDGRGVPFSREVVMNGKWVGTLTGKLHVRYYGGSPNNGDEIELLEEMNDWHRLLTLSRKSAMPAVAVTDQAPEAAAVYDAGITRRMETISATTVQGTMAAVVADDELDFEPMERPTLPFLMTLKERTRHRRAALDLDLGSIAEGARSENERESDVSRDSDLEDMEGADGIDSVRASTMLEADVDDDAAAEEDPREVWMEDGYVVSKTGKRWAKHEFVCTATGKPLIDEEFLMMDGLPYCRKAYMDLFGKGLCAGCLQLLERGADVIAAVGYKFHAACFVCAHTGRHLPIYEPYYEHDGLPYCAEAYLELFHSCPKCLETVPFTAEDGDPNKGVRAIGKVWHTRCLNCASCGCNFDGACYAYDMEDGRGSQPYCENCYRDNFMPTCAGCNEHIMLGSEEAVHACGQLWHREHFRCAASGQPILDEYYENNGLPYCAAKYFELFGQRCAHCGEVVTEEIIEAMGQAWHPEHFVCASSGTLLPKDEHGSFQYYEKDLKPYCREEYARLFCQDCARCGERVIDDKIMFHQHHFHPDCFTCEQCSCDLRERSRYAAPTTNRPYCDACFTQNFGKICAACSFVIDVNDQQVEVGDKHWHAEHFVCGNCNKSLIGIGFAEHEGIPFCIPCYEEAWASRCDTCGKPLSIDEDHIFIHESGKQYHRECYRCFICDQVFDDNAAIFIQNGHPFCQDDFADLFCENFCASCEKGIFGQRVVLIDKDWHPECIHCFECKRDLTSQPVFARFELGREHDKYISCQDHMIAAFAQLSDHGKDVVNGQFHAKAVASRNAKSSIYSERLAEADRMSTERASLMLDNSNKARNRARSLMQTFMEDMRRTSGRFSVSMEDINRAGALAGLGQPLESISEAQGSVKGSRPGSAATDDQPHGADEASPMEESPQPADVLDGRSPTPPLERPPTPPLPPIDEPPPTPPPLPEDESEVPPPVLEEPPLPSPDTQETKQPDITSAIVKPVDIPSLAALTVPSHFTFDNDISGSVEKRGWLYKKGGGTSFMGRRNWTQRYFSLANGILSYYKSDKEYKTGEAPIKNCTFNLSQCRVELEETKNKGDLRGFAIIPLNPQGGHKTLHLRAENEDVRHQWVVALSFGSTKKTTA